MRALLCALGLAAIVASCSEIVPGQTFTIDAPSETEFPPVGDFLNHRCGSLDCHGTVARNMKVYGHEGLRLSSTDVPGGSPTTDAEYEATYRSVVALEPEIMSEVVKDHGQDPERLTFYRKPAGIESHKGGTLFHEGGQQDTCIRSWLAGTTDANACAGALTAP